MNIEAKQRLTSWFSTDFLDFCLVFLSSGSCWPGWWAVGSQLETEKMFLVDCWAVWKIQVDSTEAIELENNNSHGLLPPGGFSSIFFDRVVPYYFQRHLANRNVIYILQHLTLGQTVVRCCYLCCSTPQCKKYNEFTNKKSCAAQNNYVRSGLWGQRNCTI